MNSFIKRAIIILISLLAVIIPLTVLAAQEYVIDDIGVTAAINDDLLVLTRDMEQDDPMLGMLGLSYSDFMELMELRNAYLDIINLTDGTEIVLMQIDEGVIADDLSDFSTSQLEAMKPAILASAEAAAPGSVFSDMGSFESPTALWLVFGFEISQDGSTVQGVEFFTNKNSKSYALTAYCYDGEFTDEMLESAYEVLNGLTFTEVSSLPTALPADNAGNSQSSAYSYIPGQSSYRSEGLPLWAIIAIASAAVILLLAVILLVFSKRRKAKASPFIICSSCGAQVKSDSRFCDICGNMINGK